MNRRLIFYILGMLILAFASGMHAEGVERDFTFGDRPSDGVFDPADVLLPKERQEIAAPLAKVLENEGIDVLIVVLPEIGDAPAQHVARGFREKWSDRLVNVVVLHVPGDPESPWIFPGEVVNRVVKSEKLQESLEAARKRARAEPGDYAKIRAASVEAADLMRYWTGGAVLRSEAIITEGLNRQLAFEKRQRLIKLSVVLGLAGVIPVIAVLILFLARMKKRVPRSFPPVRRVSRLGAPYAGGNTAISRFK